MHYSRLGRTGLTVSRIALGMMTYGTPAWRGALSSRLTMMTFRRLGPPRREPMPEPLPTISRRGC